MKKFLLSIAVALTVSTITAQQLSPAQMINIAGKQRMLSQKIAKAYLMKALGYNNASVNKDLSISKIIFQRNIETLSSNSTSVFNSKVKSAVDVESNSWKSFARILELPQNKNNANRVLQGSNELLKSAQNVVATMENESVNIAKYASSKNLLSTINLSGKQRMLSQRACVYYLAAKLFNKKSNFDMLSAVFHDIDSALLTLLNNDLNSPDVEEAIGNALLTFEDLRSKRESFLNGNVSPELVFEATNTLTKNFDKVTHLYSELN